MLFGSSGIRRPFGPELIKTTREIGGCVGASCSSIVIGRDARTTGHLLEAAFTAGAAAAGCHVVSGGVAPTPTVAYAARHHDAGCMITASHNPEEYNGIKLLNPDGSAFSLARQQEIEKTYTMPHSMGWNQQGHTKEVDIIDPYMDAILDAVPLPEGLHVVLDCGNGAASRVTPVLLRRGGVRYTGINCTVQGFFARPSEPLRENLPYIPAMVKQAKAAGALIHDGDADRFMAFDNKGNYINGDHLLMLFAEWTNATTVVTTVDASMAIEDVASVRRTAVGDSFVSEALVSGGDFGGEPSGSWIFPHHSLCPDGPYAAALFCAMAAEWDIAEKIAEYPDYPIIRRSFRREDGYALLLALGAENPTDGIRIEEEDGWCLIRASGTEPKVRVTAEGRDKEAAERMAQRGEELLSSRQLIH
ncbi:MAG: phosphoglucomutase [Methanomicrobiales archaeon]|nr:phosphoglucomutase [Methanomicrobiales archaeon]